MTDVNTHTIDLSWVQFSEDPGEKCGTLKAECSNEATWYGHYAFNICPEAHKYPYCQLHKEAVDRDVSNGKPFRCRCEPDIHYGAFTRWERIKP